MLLHSIATSYSIKEECITPNLVILMTVYYLVATGCKISTRVY